VDAATARAILGVAAAASAEELRAAYRARLRASHPDLHEGDDAGTTEVVEAYRLLADLPPELVPAPAPVAVVVDGDTVTADLPSGDLFLLLVDAAETIGEVSYLDPRAGLLEVVVDVEGYGACSVVLTLQGRAAGGATEAWATVEPLSGWRKPPVDAITGLLAEALGNVASDANRRTDA
jgi:hypothetical protein